MAETQKAENGRQKKVPEFLREPLAAAQTRIGQLEAEAQRLLKDLVERGRASRKDIEQIVQRLSKQDWTFPELKLRVDRLREQGAERAAEWRDRAETFRTEALERVIELQGRAIAFLGVATRDEVRELSREVDQLAKRIERAARARKGRKASSPEA